MESIYTLMKTIGRKIVVLLLGFIYRIGSAFDYVASLFSKETVYKSVESPKDNCCIFVFYEHLRHCVPHIVK